MNDVSLFCYSEEKNSCELSELEVSPSTPVVVASEELRQCYGNGLKRYSTFYHEIWICCFFFRSVFWWTLPRYNHSYCHPNTIKGQYSCLCEDGFSPAEIGAELGGCYRVCNKNGLTLLHANEIKYTKCMDGNLLCLVEGNTLNHGESLIMEDGNLRICDQGIMKLPFCESVNQTNFNSSLCFQSLQYSRNLIF